MTESLRRVANVVRPFQQLLEVLWVLEAPFKWEDRVDLGHFMPGDGLQGLEVPQQPGIEPYGYSTIGKATDSNGYTLPMGADKEWNGSESLKGASYG